MGSGGDFYLKVLISIVITAIPCYICLIASLIRYWAIRRDGINRMTKYSRLTKSKLFLCYGSALFYLLPIPASLLIKTYWLNQSWAFSFLYIIYSVTWLFLGILVQMEHARNLNNELYCHKLFWVLNPIFILVFSITVVIINNFEKDIFDYCFMILEFIFGSIAFVFMTMTRKKKQRDIPVRHFSYDMEGDVSLTISSKERPIKVYLNYRINKEDIISFRVVTEFMDKEVQKRFNEFLDVENFLLEYVKTNIPNKIHDVPIIDKKGLNSSGGITSVAEKRLK